MPRFQIGDKVRCKRVATNEIDTNHMPAGIYEIVAYEPSESFEVVDELTNQKETFMSDATYIVKNKRGTQYSILSEVIEGNAQISG